MANRKLTRDMTAAERKEHRSWRAKIIGVVSPRRRRPQGRVTRVDLNLRGGKEALQKLRRLAKAGAAPEINPAARRQFERIHAARRERNAARAGRR